MSQARFQKRMREKAKQEKQAAKRERKAERAEAVDTDEPADDVPPQATVLEQLAALHASFADDAIDFDEFEERKQELLAQLDV